MLADGGCGVLTMLLAILGRHSAAQALALQAITAVGRVMLVHGASKPPPAFSYAAADAARAAALLAMRTHVSSAS